MNGKIQRKRTNSSRGGLRSVLLLALLAARRAPAVRSFQLNTVFAGIKPPNLNIFGPAAAGGVAKAKAQLLETIADTGSGKDADLAIQSEVLSLVKYLETNAPASPTLLTNPNESKLVDGDWYLQYTQPYELKGVENFEELEWKPEASTRKLTKKLTRKKANAKGQVSFLGIVNVDTSKSRTIQTIDTSTMLFANSVEKDFGTIRVEGFFELDSVPNRIVAAFERGGLTLNNGLVVDFGLLFKARALIRGGLKASGWLETTYIDESMRIGRGNRGSLFVLTRDDGL